MALNRREECRECGRYRATMQTRPCGHVALCRPCFILSIQATVERKQLPLRCVACKARILRLEQLPPRLTEAEAEQVVVMREKKRNNYKTSRDSVSSFMSTSSDASSTSSSSTSSAFNFDLVSNFQSVNLTPRSSGHQQRRSSRRNSSRRKTRTRSESPQAHFIESPESPSSLSTSSSVGSSSITSIMLNNNQNSSCSSTPTTPPSPSSSSSMLTSSSSRSSRLGTPLSPIRESRRESSSVSPKKRNPDEEVFVGSGEFEAESASIVLNRRRVNRSLPQKSSRRSAFLLRRSLQEQV